MRSSGQPAEKLEVHRNEIVQKSIAGSKTRYSAWTLATKYPNEDLLQVLPTVNVSEALLETFLRLQEQ